MFDQIFVDYFVLSPKCRASTNVSVENVTAVGELVISQKDQPQVVQ